LLEKSFFNYKLYNNLVRLDQSKTTAVVFGGSLDAKFMFDFSNFFYRIGSFYHFFFTENTVNNVDFGINFRSNFFYSEQNAFVSVVGVNPNIDLPLILSKWYGLFQKKRIINNNFFAICAVGPQINTTWVNSANFSFAGQIGNTFTIINSFIFGTTKTCQTFLRTSVGNSLFIFNSAIFNDFFYSVKSMQENICWGFGTFRNFTMHTSTSSAYEYGISSFKYASTESGFFTRIIGNSFFLFEKQSVCTSPFVFFIEGSEYLLSNFEFSDFFKNNCNKLFYTAYKMDKTFNIDKMALKNFIIPGITSFEHAAFHMNNEGRLQNCQRVMQALTGGQSCGVFFINWFNVLGVVDGLQNNNFENEVFSNGSNVEFGIVPTQLIFPKTRMFTIGECFFSANSYICYQWSSFYQIGTLAKASAIMAKCREKEFVASYALFFLLKLF